LRQRRNSITRGLIHSQSSGDRNIDDVDSFSDSRQPSLEDSHLSTTADIHINGSVPRGLGADNEAFDAGDAETAAENQPEPGQTTEKTRAEMVADEADVSKLSVSAEQDGVGRLQSKKVSFVDNEEPTRNTENSTQLN